MATIIFKEAAADSQKGFRMGRPESLFKNGVTFTVTGKKFGNYTVDGVESKYSNSSQAIVLTTSIGEDVNLNRFLKNRKVVYDAKGDAHIVEAATFKADLLAHMEKLGRREDDPTMLKGSVEEVANHALKFFDGKTIKVTEDASFFAKDNGRLVPGNPLVQFSL